MNFFRNNITKFLGGFYILIILVVGFLIFNSYNKTYSFYLKNDEISLDMNKNYTIELTPYDYTYFGSENYVFNSSDENIIQIDEQGIIIPKNAGEATVTIKSQKGFNTKKLLVKVISVTSETIDIVQENLNLTQGENQKIDVVINEDKNMVEDLIYTTEDKNVAIVDSNGSITATGVGTTNIIVSTQTGVTETIKVTTEEKKINAESITLDKNEATLEIGGVVILNATIKPDNVTNKNIKWTSSNKNIATVENGKVTAKKEGTVTITAAINGKQTQAKIKVENKKIEVNSIELKSSKSSIRLDEKLQLQYNILPTNATNQNVTFKSSNEDIATIKNGVLIPKKIGSVTITATTHNNKTSKITIKITEIPATSITLDRKTSNMYVGGSTTLVSTILPVNTTNKNVKWTSSDESIATVENGKIVAKKQGKVTITAKTANNLSTTCTVIIKEKEVLATNISISELQNMYVGETKTIKATINPSNTTNKKVTWTSSNNDIATVTNGKVTAKKQGTVTITAVTSNNLKDSITINVKVKENSKEYIIYVSPSGNDSNDGSINSPVKTLQHAKNLARTYAKKGDKNVIVYLRAGTYILNDTLKFTQEDSGINGHTVKYTSYNNEKVTISGGRQITGWSMHDPSRNIWVADAKNINSRDFFVNGNRATIAKTEQLNVVAIDSSSIVTTNQIMKSLSRPQDVIIVINNLWTQSRVPVSYSSNGILGMVKPAWTTYYTTSDFGGAPANKNQIKYAENAYEFLDSSGEWYLNKEQGKIYYIPRSGENMNTAQAYLGNLEQIINLQGSNGSPVKNIIFQGLTFSHTTWLQPSSPGGLITIQANYYKKEGTTIETKHNESNQLVSKASIKGEITTNVAFKNNTFKNLGNACIHLGKGTKSAKINYNTFEDCAGSGIILSDFSESYHHIIAKDGSNLNSNWYLISEKNSITDNRISNVASVYNGGVGIQVGYVRHTDISYNTINNLPYTAISFGWGWGFNQREMSGVYYTDETGTFIYSNNSITHNYIDNIMNTLFDGGGIYTLGRNDRSLISDNYIANVKNDYGAIYLDNGSMGFDVINNVIYNSYRNFIYKGDYNYIKNNYSRPAANPNMAMPELIGNTPHFEFVNNEMWDESRIAQIKSAAGVR